MRDKTAFSARRNPSWISATTSGYKYKSLDGYRCAQPILRLPAPTRLRDDLISIYKTTSYFLLDESGFNHEAVLCSEDFAAKAQRQSGQVQAASARISTPAAPIALSALASEPWVSRPRQASSSTTISNPSRQPSSAE